jgi:NarL family two-component system response regulator LiaR
MTLDTREPSAESVRVLIVDDHEVVRKGIRAVLSETSGFEVVGEATNGHDAVLCARELRPDVILMDLLMPGMDGVEATRQIIAGQREMGVLVLTSFATDEEVFPALKAGALGYLLKDASSDELVRGIRRVARGESSLDPTIARRLLQEVSRRREPDPSGEALTARETDVLRLLGAGLSNRAIADCMTISERTVRTHMGHIFAKLHLTSRTQAALYAVREGLAEPSKVRADGE